jgi:hypothetical protein
VPVLAVQARKGFDGDHASLASRRIDACDPSPIEPRRESGNPSWLISMKDLACGSVGHFDRIFGIQRRTPGGFRQAAETAA